VTLLVLFGNLLQYLNRNPIAVREFRVQSICGAGMISIGKCLAVRLRTRAFCAVVRRPTILPCYEPGVARGGCHFDKDGGGTVRSMFSLLRVDVDAAFKIGES
jgi:hypothetical protein